MKQIRKIFDFYILFNIHVALAVVSLYLIMNNHPDFIYLSFVFLSTIASYNLIRLFSFGSNRFFIKKYLVRNKYLIFILLLISSGLSFVYYFRLENNTKLMLLPFFLITALYNLDFRLSPIPKLRNNGTLKIFSVAFVWAGLTVLVPDLGQLKFLIDIILFKFVFVLLYVLLLTLAFDQRDLLIDAHSLKTIPQRYQGKMKIIYLGIGLILLILSKFVFSHHLLWIAPGMIGLSVYFAMKSHEHRSFYYTAFWIESMPILWFLLVKIVV